MARKSLALDRNDPVQHPRRKSIDEIALIRDFRNGMSTKALSEKYKLARRGIDQRLRENGERSRTRSESMFLRMSQTSKPERMKLTAAAHAASRGRIMPMEVRERVALTRQRKLRGQSRYEIELLVLLQARGLAPIPQQAIGPYNCDLGTFPVAVEIFGGHWHWGTKHERLFPRRTRYLLDRGWHVLVILVDERHPIIAGVADYVVSYVEQARRSPASVREYRVIRGTGETLASGRHDDDQISSVLAIANRRNSATGRYETVARNARRM